MSTESTPAPHVWFKLSAAQPRGDGSWYWPTLQCRCKAMGIQLDNGMRIRFDDPLLSVKMMAATSIGKFDGE